MTSCDWHSSLVGIPYSIEGGGGDCLDQLHCWGLVRVAFRLGAGIDLPSYEDVAPNGIRARASVMSDAVTGSDWIQIDHPWQPLDVIVMLARDGGKRYPTHCGVVTPNGMILHTEAHHSAVMVRPDHASIRHRIFGAYRYAAIA